MLMTRIQKEAFLLCWTALLSPVVQSFSPAGLPTRSALLLPQLQRQRENVFQQHVHVEREADMYEQMMGGQRFEMTALPDSMIQTTLFVGNLCEFVVDDDLSQLFQSVSVLQSVPACVVRKADMSSRQYGFVSFPTVEEKEAAILRFHGYEFRGKPLKVECVKDHPNAGRVEVPEAMVYYVSGAVKHVSKNTKGENKKKKGRFNMNSLRRISRDDVERLSRGQAAKKKGSGSRNVPHRLNEMERQEMQRAQNKGYLTLMGAGNRRTRRGSPLKNSHRQWCDARAKPQIILYKTSGSERKVPLDTLEVDLSPLRLIATAGGGREEVETILAQYKAEIEVAARNAGMSQSMDVEEEIMSLEENDSEADSPFELEASKKLSSEGEQKAWATKPIWQLPAIHAVDKPFWGQRSQAKHMAKELALLWGTQELDKEFGHDDDELKTPYKNKARAQRKGGKSKMRGLSQHRKRGGGHRQSFY